MATSVRKVTRPLLAAAFLVADCCWDGIYPSSHGFSFESQKVREERRAARLGGLGLGSRAVRMSPQQHRWLPGRPRAQASCQTDSLLGYIGLIVCRHCQAAPA
jgi:hypothetical protein